MTRDDIIRMASEAGFLLDTVSKLQLRPFYIAQPIELERFANLVAAAEREECIGDCNAEASAKDIAQRIIERIRARGQQ